MKKVTKKETVELLIKKSEEILKRLYGEHDYSKHLSGTISRIKRESKTKEWQWNCQEIVLNLTR